MNPSPATSDPERSQHDQVNLTTATIREIVVHWEKRRLLYNGILLVPGLMIVGRVFLLGKHAHMHLATTIGGIMAYVLAFAVMANICFTLAPYLEFVLNTRGYRLTGMKIRPFVFVMGLVLSGFVMFVGWILLESGGVVI